MDNCKTDDILIFESQRTGTEKRYRTSRHVASDVISHTKGLSTENILSQVWKSYFPNGVGIQDGPNIIIPIESLYTGTLNSNTGDYTFTEDVECLKN